MPLSFEHSREPLPSLVVPRGAARTFERKRRRRRRFLLAEVGLPLGDFFTAGVEIDDGAVLEAVTRFAADFALFRSVFDVEASWGRGVEIKLRRLGRHKADGLYFPDRRVLALDLRGTTSLAHEFAHLLDYRSREGVTSGFDPGRAFLPALSAGAAFKPYHEALLRDMVRRGAGDPRLRRARGRLSWRYLAARSECFARSFEQALANELGRPTSIVHPASRYEADPLFFERLPDGLSDYFRSILAAGPEGLASSFTESASRTNS